MEYKYLNVPACSWQTQMSDVKYVKILIGKL
jgi:hypothetical protein